MNSPQIFDGGQIGRIRAIVADGIPWFVARDVAQALGYSNSRDAIAKHVDPDDVAKRDAIDSLGRKQKTILINESGLYALIFGSRLESARKFKRWVTSEVLPVIRSTGSYASSEALSALEARIASLEAGGTAGLLAAPVRVIPYSPRSIAVVGDTRALRGRLKALGGWWCPFLTVDGLPARGWVFRADRMREVVAAIEAE